MDLRTSYTEQLQALLPPGKAWNKEAKSNLTALLGALASGFVRVHQRAERLVLEADPRSTIEMLPEWEANLGLPEICASTTQTLQERVAAVVEKFTRTGGQSRQYFIDIAEKQGYQVQLETFKPFIAGISRCGDALNGGHDVRLNWRIRVLEARNVYFRTGISRCGERLLTIRRAEDLECILNKLKPAHTNLIFAYEGA